MNVVTGILMEQVVLEIGERKYYVVVKHKVSGIDVLGSVPKAHEPSVLAWLTKLPGNHLLFCQLKNFMQNVKTSYFTSKYKVMLL